MEESNDCYVDVDVLFRRRRKTEKKGKKIFGEGEYLFFWRRIKTEKEKEENIWRQSLQKFAWILRSLGFGFETFAIFWRVSVSVSEILVSEKKSWFRFRRIWSQIKSIGFGKFGVRKKVSVSENLVSEKKSRYRFQLKFWYRHSVVLREFTFSDFSVIVKVKCFP